LCGILKKMAAESNWKQKGEIARDWRKLHSERPHNFNFSPNNVRGIK
jgi:hypothetical protein